MHYNKNQEKLSLIKELISNLNNNGADLLVSKKSVVPETFSEAEANRRVLLQVQQLF